MVPPQPQGLSARRGPVRPPFQVQGWFVWPLCRLQEGLQGGDRSGSPPGSGARRGALPPGRLGPWLGKARGVASGKGGKQAPGGEARQGARGAALQEALEGRLRLRGGGKVRRSGPSELLD